jgi:hypothetical protein
MRKGQMKLGAPVLKSPPRIDTEFDPSAAIEHSRVHERREVIDTGSDVREERVV